MQVIRRVLRYIVLRFKWESYGINVWIKEIPANQQAGFAYMKLGIASKKCPICGNTYWVVGNPRKKSGTYPVCRRWKCYKEYYGGK